MLAALTPAAAAATHVGELSIAAAGLVDVDLTAFIQLGFFLALVFTLPGLIFKPLLARFEQRVAKTEGARSEARSMLREADEQVVVYEEATAKQKQKALAERAAARADAQKQAADLVETVKKDTNFRITQGITNLFAAEAHAKREIEKDAAAISVMIADKIVEG